MKKVELVYSHIDAYMDGNGNCGCGGVGGVGPRWTRLMPE